MCNDKKNDISDMNNIYKKILSHGCFASIIVTTDIEFESIFETFNWKQLYKAQSGYMYYYTEIIKNNHKQYIIMTRQSEMGSMAAAMTTSIFLLEFKPKYVIMPGILAGINFTHNTDLVYGDIITGTMFWDCTIGKFVKASQSDISYGNIGFLPKHKPIYLQKNIITTIENAVNSIDCHWSVHLGPIACSNNVIATNEFIKKQVLSQVENTLGLDMESYGIAYTCKRFNTIGAYPIVIKAISDFANEDKSYDFQKYASMNSCEFCRFLCDSVLE